MALDDLAPPGSFCWLILSTPDPGGAEGFYRELFGWQVADSGVPTFLKDGKPVGSIVNRAEDERARGQPPNWLPFVRVPNLEVAIERARELTGKLWFPIYDSGIARVALIKGPTKEIFGLWETPPEDPAPIVANAGVMSWFELVTPEPERAMPFYEQLFGWRFTNEGTYTVLTNGAEPIGGVLRLEGDWEDHAFLSAIGQTPGEKWEIPPHWMPFFRVDDCDEVLRRAEHLGGMVRARTDYLHTFGRFAVLVDPQGAYFSILARA